MAVPVLNRIPPAFARGATIQFSSTFFDADGNVANPSSAQVNIAFVTNSGVPTSILVAMAQAAGGAWIAQWDSRSAGPGTVSWSVETPGSAPVSVEDGQFMLTANPANQATF